jgi:hypothetical protein
MAVSAIVRGDGSIEDYRRVRDALDFDITPPPGLILHTMADLGDHTLQAIDVWDSARAAQEFYEDRLRPIIAEVAPGRLHFPPPEIRELAGLLQP